MFSLVSDTPDPELADPELADPELADPELADPELADPELADPDVDPKTTADPESDEVCSKIYPSLCTYTHKNNRVSLFQCKLQITIGTLLWGKIIC